MISNTLLNCNGRLLNISSPVVMGILNCTPDSFYDGGKFNDETDIISHVEKMLAAGASIIDIGAQSSRPGAALITAEEEWKRLEPVLKIVITNFPQTVISVDTFWSSVAAKAMEAGAAIINDISAGTMDDNMLAIAAQTNAVYIMMHMHGTPQTMQENPFYKNVTLDVLNFFAERTYAARKAGIKDIIVDPGFGFGKTVEHNFQLLNQLEDFKVLNCPVLAGLSRKSMINKVLKTNPANALNGTTVLNTVALLKGATILRVHDVKEAIEAVKLVNALTV